MNYEEIPLTFDCDGATLVGMIHRPEEIRARGVLAIVAGGPQYRGGVGRLQVQLARTLAAAGVPVMRFDYRGLGDSEGQFRGFQDVGADLAAAARTFRDKVPGMESIVLWGGCDAASGIMINAWRMPEVSGLMIGNPWVHSHETGDAVTVKHHYRKRILERDFWLKVIRLQYNPLPAIAVVGRSVAARIRRKLAGGGKSGGSGADERSQPFVERMRLGMSRFKGDVLLLLSGRSMVSKEFDELLTHDAGWREAMASVRSLERHDMPDADQTYSSIAARHEVIGIARVWLLERETAANREQACA